MLPNKARLGGFPRNAVLASAVLLFVGCAAHQTEWKPAGYYVTTESVLGCDSYRGRKGVVVKKTAVLSLGLQRRLLALLDQAASTDKGLSEELGNYRDQLMCWYETPEKDVELKLGAFCENPFEITFHLRDEKWVISSASKAIVLCHIRKR